MLAGMRVRDGMTPAVLTVGPGHTLAQVAQRMAERNVGSAIVLDPDGAGPGILTERDILRAVADGVDTSRTLVDAHHDDEITIAHPDWDLHRAAATMLRGGFRHLVVCENDEVVGVLSMRDVVRLWATERGPSL